MAPPRKTHCIRNHEFTPANTYWTKDGKQRQCRACWNSRYKPKTRQPVRAAPTDVGVLAYAAGILDGEGSVSIRLLKRPKRGKNYHSLTVRVTNTDEALILWLVGQFGGSVTSIAPSAVGRKAAFEWTIQSRHARMFLATIRPYLLIKARQADIGIALQDSMIAPGQRRSEALFRWREGLRGELHCLNARGAPIPADVNARELGEI